MILAAPPYADGNPTIAGVLRDGQTLTAVSAWSGTAPISLTYQWQRCDAVATSCVDLAGATASTYRLASAEVGSRMRIRIGALNAGGGGSAMSDLAGAGDPAGIVAPDSPHATGAAVLSGTAIEAATLTSSDGIFTGTPPMTRSIRWQRCDGAGTGCTDIAGATGSDRVLTAADRGATLRAVVTTANGQGSDSIASAPSAVVVMAPPRNLVAPSVAPDTGLRDGATLTSTDGGWAGSAPMSLAYRWERCRTACVAVPAAAGPTYMLTTTDVGFALRLVVTATNGAGSTSQASPLTGVVGTNPPVSIVPPTVAGTARDGDVLTAVDGAWIGPIVFETTYEWWRCDTLGANCTIISGATSRNVILGAADLGLSLRARVVRTSAGGTTGAFSAPTLPVVAAAPVNLSAPKITGAAAVGKTLTADRGGWTGTPALDFGYQWQRCAADGSSCDDVEDSVGPTYRATAQDDGASMRVVVTALNAVGSASATSASTPEVQTDPPATLSPPRIEASGPVAVGVTLTAQPGTWGGALPISFEYQWARCDAVLTGCIAVSGATGSTYLLAKADVGRRIVVTVTATNVVASTTAVGDGTTTVLPEPPSSVALPAVTAGAGVRDGARLVASTGTWKGATGTTYTLIAADVGYRMRVRVAAANTTAEITTESAATTAVVPAPPAPVAAPAKVVPPAPPAFTAAPTIVALADKVAGKPTGTAAAPAAGKQPGAATADTTKKAATRKKAATKKASKTKATTKKPSKTKTTTKASKTKAAAKKGKKATSSPRKPSRRSSTKPIAELQRLQITPAGSLLVVLRCPRASPRACGAAGTVVAGTSQGEVIPDTSLSFTVRAATVPKRKTVVRTFKLTTAQREELRTLSDVSFRVRLSAPGTPNRVDEVFVRARVPAELLKQAEATEPE